VFDTPPCLPVTDAQVMAAQVDGVLLVAAMGEAKKEEVRHAKQLLDRAYARTLGLILNKMTNMVDMVGPPGPTANSRGPQARGAVTAHAPASGYPPAALPESPAPTHSSRCAGEDCPEVRTFQRGHALSYVGLFLFTVATYFRPWELLSALSSFTSMALVIGLLTLIVFFPSQLRLEGTLTARTREVDLLLFLCLAGLLSIPLAISPGVAWNGFSNFLKPVVIFIVMVNAVRSERRLQGLLFVMLAASCVFSVAMLVDYRSGGYPLAGAGTTAWSGAGPRAVEGYRPRGIVGGIFANPNDLALFLVTMTPMIIGLLLGARGLIRKLPYGVCAALLGAAIVITYSRGGFLALIAAAAVLAWKLGRRNPIAVALVMILTIAVFTLFVPGNYGSRIASILNPASDASASQRRDQLYRSILVALAHPLLGVGMHNYPIVGIQELQTHNAYTQVAAEMGIPAAVLYTSFIVVPLLRLRQIERETLGVRSYGRTHYLAMGLQASLAGYMVGSFFASVAYLWGVYYLVGYAVCLRRIYEAGLRPTAPGTGPALRAPASAGRQQQIASNPMGAR